LKLRLADEDRERYSIPEWIDADLSNFSVGEAKAVEAAGGNHGVFRTGGGIDAVLVRLWVWLRRAGAAVPDSIDDLEVNLAGYQLVETPGKAPSATKPARTRSTSAATSPSSTSPRKR
jgi:hypothetical protein